MSNQYDYLIRCETRDDRNKLKELATLCRGLFGGNNFDAIKTALEIAIASKIQFK
jgi:hypothetical protein